VGEPHPGGHRGVREGGQLARLRHPQRRGPHRLHRARPFVCPKGDPACQQQLAAERFNTGVVGLGGGYRFAGGGTLDAYARLDYGQLEADGIRDLQFKVEYLGLPDDKLREVRLEDKLRYRTVEEGLERPLLLQGVHGRVASQGAEPLVAGQVNGGVRRGAAMRDFLTGPRQEIYALSKKYILPGSERVWVDGECSPTAATTPSSTPPGSWPSSTPAGGRPLGHRGRVRVRPDAQEGPGPALAARPAAGDKEVGDWTRTGEARLISEEGGLYAQIDGAAPKYIERGWTRSVYAEYRQGSRNIQVAVHDMGDEVNALSIYNNDLPPAREPVADRDNLVLDVGLATSYAAKAYAGTYYIELSIDEKSDPAKQSLKLFATQILDRGSTTGASALEGPQEWLAAARVSSSPFAGSEFGARIVQAQGFGARVGETPLRRLTTGVADARYETDLGQGGRLTSYAEIAGTHDGGTRKDGWAALGKLRVSHPYLEGTLSARHHSPDYTPLGTDQTMFGKLDDEVRFSATATPPAGCRRPRSSCARWPTTRWATRRRPARHGSPAAQPRRAALAVAAGRPHPLRAPRRDRPLQGRRAGRVRPRPLPASTTWGSRPLGARPVQLLAGRDQGRRPPLLPRRPGAARAPGDQDRPHQHRAAYALFRTRTVGLQAEQAASSTYRLALGAQLRRAQRHRPRPHPPGHYRGLRRRPHRRGPGALQQGQLLRRAGHLPGQWWSLLARWPSSRATRWPTTPGRGRAQDRALPRPPRRQPHGVAGSRLELELYQMWELDLAEEDQHATAEMLSSATASWSAGVHLADHAAGQLPGQRTLNDLVAAPGATPWARPRPGSTWPSG
jgi:hypothetical protein